jgi:hypothetical protein
MAISNHEPVGNLRSTPEQRRRIEQVAMDDLVSHTSDRLSVHLRPLELRSSERNSPRRWVLRCYE